ncbi:MAG: hypothetical protein M3Z35_11155, partial [Nitrospirota bacterium]|nr:hypothetical protein [Nitrospirota bacterium]
DGPLSQFLGDAEQPSHTRWVMAKLKGLYVAPDYPFRRARRALADFERIVVGAHEGETIKDALKQFFFKPAEVPRNSPKVKGNEPVVVPPAVPAVLEVRGIDGGFVASRPPDSPAIRRIRVDVRYDVRKGSPKFRAADFDLESSAIDFKVEGPDSKLTKLKNEGAIFLEDVRPGFKMRVTGFDTNRDLFIRAEEIVDGA